jgi:SAM-dependent methyltransferase
MMVCRICGNSFANKVYEVKEMLCGLDEMFPYFECSLCGCLQIEKIPDNMSEYYPEYYYSYNNIERELNRNKVIKKIISLRDSYAISGKGIVGRCLSWMKPNEILKQLLEIRLEKSSKILDVGCGSGMHLYRIKNAGYYNLLGVDPYLQSDIAYENRLQIRKMSVQDVGGTWDLIMFNHSFEHMPNPQEVLLSVAELLDDQGTCLIRVPISSSFAWQEYKTYWVQIDAPRHFFLFSVRSMNLLAKKAGFTIERIIYDSTEFQFVGSEKYRKDIPLYSDKSNRKNSSLFSKAEISRFRKKAQELNGRGLGDQAAFYLRKI